MSRNVSPRCQKGSARASAEVTVRWIKNPLEKLKNVNQSLLRYWETEFKTINPKRSPKGTRYYSQKDIEEIKLIHYLLKERKLKIEGAKQVLKHKRESTVRSQQVVERLKSLRSELIAIMEELE